MSEAGQPQNNYQNNGEYLNITVLTLNINIIYLF